MLTLDIDEFMLELKEGTLKHVGASNKTATAKLYDVTGTELREFGDQRLKLSCEDESGNEIEVALDPEHVRTIADRIDELDEHGQVLD